MYDGVHPSAPPSSSLLHDVSGDGGMSKLLLQETSIEIGEAFHLCEIKIVPGPGMMPDMLFFAIVDGNGTHSACFDLSSETADLIKKGIEHVYEAAAKAAQVAE